MSVIIHILILLNIALSIYFIFKSSIKKGIEINHVSLFILGALFYWVTPIVVGMNGIFEGQTSMNIWYQIFYEIDEKNIVLYLINISFFVFAFYIGSKHGKEEKLLKEDREFKWNIKKFLTFDIKYLDIFYYINLIALLWFTYIFRNDFFKGYQGELTLTLRKGTFVATSLVMLVISILYCVKKKELNQHLSFIRILLNKYTITYAVFASLILTLGGRMYFLSSIVVYITFYCVYFNKINMKLIIGIAILGLISAGIIGMKRQDISGINLEGILIHVFLEPLYTDYALLDMLYEGTNYLLRLPIYFVTDFINLIPSVILPNKLDYIIKPIVYNPQGALSSYTSFMHNFGIAGTTIVLYFSGNILSRIKESKLTIFKCIYVCICGWIPFTLFRDEFFVSVVKNIFEFSILIPLIIAIIVSLLTYKKIKNKKRG